MKARQLPIVKLSFGNFFVDIRLDEIRNIADPYESYPMDYILDNPNSFDVKVTEQDHKNLADAIRREIEGKEPLITLTSLLDS